MAKLAAQLKAETLVSEADAARVIDIHTRQPWRPPARPVLPFVAAAVLTLAVVVSGAWLCFRLLAG